MEVFPTRSGTNPCHLMTQNTASRRTTHEIRYHIAASEVVVIIGGAPEIEILVAEEQDAFEDKVSPQIQYHGYQCPIP